MAQNGMHAIHHNLHNLCGTQNMRHDVYHLVWLVASNGMQHSARLEWYATSSFLSASAVWWHMEHAL